MQFFPVESFNCTIDQVSISIFIVPNDHSYKGGIQRFKFNTE